MSIRAASIYVSSETRRNLWIIARSQDIASPDEAAEMLLSWAISEKYPALADHLKKIEDLEKEVLEKLRPQP